MTRNFPSRTMLANVLIAMSMAVQAAPPAGTPTADTFAPRMHEAMQRMDSGMRTAPMTGNAEHDFVTMMIPHHQGAIEMASSLLAQTRDPELRNLAQSIVTEQATEITLMRAWLEHHPNTCNPNHTCYTP